MTTNRSQKLKKIRDQVWHLKKSPFYQYRLKNNYYPVIGEGSHTAKIMFIGEAPGRNEAETGRPFCGTAGKILDQLLESIKIPRNEVYITNIVKDRPPNNRDPQPEEIDLYHPFLVKQINIIQPQIIATLGRFSMNFIIKLFNLEDKLQPISRIHGQVFVAKAKYGNIKIIPLYHPAVVAYNYALLPTLKKDFQVITRALAP